MSYIHLGDPIGTYECGVCGNRHMSGQLCPMPRTGTYPEDSQEPTEIERLRAENARLKAALQELVK